MNIYEKLTQAIGQQQSGNLSLAEQSYLEVLRHDARNADAHNLLGCLYKSRSEFDSAIASISTAISVDHGQPSFYNNLGACYLEKKEAVVAELCFRRALELDPKNLDSLSNLGMLLIEQRQFDEARSVLEQAAGHGPVNENVLANLVNAYRGLNLFEHALAVAERGLSVHPSSALLKMAKASALTKLSRDAEALALVESITQIPPALTAAVLKMKGSLQEIVGKLDEACATYDLALQSSPQTVELLFARSQIRKVSQADECFRQLVALEPSAQTAAGSDRTKLHFALGKAYQDTGDFAKAAGNYALGSANHLQNAHYNEEDDSRVITAFKEGFSAEYLSSLAGLGSASKRPIFVVGMSRSGTTLVEQILASHPEVFPAGELHFISEAASGMILPGGWRLSRDAEKGVAENATLRERAEFYLEKINRIPGSASRPHVTDKMPENYMNIGLISAMFPNARIIHCRRDPIDTCVSNYITLFSNQHYWSFDFGMIARTYRRYWEIMAHWRNVLPGRFLELRYEDVVADTEGAARKLLAWCDLPWDEQVLRFYETDRPVTTASVTQVRQPIYATSAGRWKKWEPYIQPLIADLRDIETQYWAEVGRAA